jgi:hypothetical protein
MKLQHAGRHRAEADPHGDGEQRFEANGAVPGTNQQEQRGSPPQVKQNWPARQA